MFVELSLTQLALTNGDFLNKCKARDKELYNACTRYDIEGVRKAIKRGANVNALPGVFGESIIGETVRNIRNGTLTIKECNKMTEEEYKEYSRKNIQKAKEIIDCLIENGADINLYGFGVGSPLLECYYANSSEMMQFLLEQGTNPNIFTNYDDAVRFGFHEWYIQSYVLSVVYDSIDGDEEEEGKMITLLEKYGVKRFIDGFDPDEYFSKFK